KSALAAALFAWHPLRVESVAWVAERKDLLCGAFAFGCLWAYAGYARRGGAPRYVSCLLLFALGLLAKPMLVTLPFVLVLLDAWPLGRARLTAPLWREKLPFLGLALASALVTVLVQRAGGAFDPLASLAFGPRLANALHAYGTYLLESFWP